MTTIRQRSKVLGLAIVIGCTLGFAVPVGAQQHVFRVGFDLDDNPATGCGMDVADLNFTGTIPGIETILVLEVDRDSSPLWVAPVSIQQCSGPGFGPPQLIDGSGWPVGLNNGYLGADVIEGHLPSSYSLNNQFVGLVFSSTSAQDNEDVVLSGANGPLLIDLGTIGIPTAGTVASIMLGCALSIAALLMLRRRGLGATGTAVGLVVILVGTGVAVAVAINLDGAIGDWGSVPPLSNDLQGDETASDPAADILQVSATTNALEIYVRIDVADLENQPPTDISLDSTSVDENMPAGSLVGNLSTVDPDIGDSHTYSLAAGTGDTDNGLFQINGDRLEVAGPLDHEAQATRSVRIETDDGNGGTYEEAFTIDVDDVNEAPSITSSATPSADENQTTAVDVQSSDPEGETESGGGLTYSTTGGVDQGLFSIDTNTGVLSFIAAPDFENPGDDNTDNVYVVEVAVSDTAGPLAGSQTINVTVTDVNEVPSITSAATANVAENQTSAADVQSTDPEGETENGGGLTYSITGGADQLLFSLNTSTGVLSFISAPDFENPGDANTDNDYLVEVTVTDSGGLTDAQTLTVTVTNVNEAPSITNSAAVNAPENQTGVVDVQSSDPEGETENGGGLVYSLTGGADQGSFSLNTATGVLTFTSPPDFENPGDSNTDNVYLVEVTVTDSGLLTGPLTFSVTVTDQLEPPVIGTDPAVYATAGCTQIRAGGPSSPPAAVAFIADADSISDKASITDLDTPVPAGLTFTVFSAPSSGTLNLESDGTFAYVPNASFTGPTDTFQYQVTDGVTPVVGTVNINVSQMVRYVHTVQGDTAGNGATGCSDSAFDNLTDAEAASTAGDTIFVFAGDTGTTALDDSIDLKNGQRLHGEGIGLSVPGFANIVAAGSTPVIDFTGGDAVTVDASAANLTGVEVRGLSLSGSTNAVDVTATGAFQVGVTISDNRVVDSGQEGIDLNPNSSGDFSVVAENNSFSTSSPTGNAFDLVTTAAAGTVKLAFNNNTDITSGANAVNIDGSSGGSVFISGFANNSVHGNTVGTGIRVVDVTFDSDTSDPDFDLVAGGSLVVGEVSNRVGGAGVVLGIGANSVSGNLSFTSINAYTVNGAALSASGSGASTGGPPPTSGFLLTVAAGIADAIGGPAVALDPLTSSVSLTNVSSTTSSSAGISLDTVSGSFSAAAGGIVGSGGGPAIEIVGGTVDVTYSGGITQANNAPAVSVSGGHNTGIVTFNTGTISATNGTGLQFSNADGTYNFNGTTTLNGGDAGIDILSGSAGTFSFGSNTSITSPSGTAFNLSGGTAGVAYSGNITQANSASTVSVAGGHTTGTVTFDTGTISATGGNGLQFNNADGTYDFSGTTTLNGGDAGIDILNGSAGTFTFASTSSITNPVGSAFNVNGSSANVGYGGTVSQNTTAAGVLIATNAGTVTLSGNLTLNTGANTAFSATGGGTVNVTGPTNTVSTTTGTGVSIDGTTIGASNVTFQSVSVDGATSGIILNDTGSSGGFIVNGDGGSTQNSSGGTIQNTTGDGISLTDTSDVTLNQIAIDDTGIHGIDGLRVNNLTINNSTIDNAGDGDEENALNLMAAVFSGQAGITGNLTLDNVDISDFLENGLEVYNESGSVTINVMNGSDFDDNDETFGVNAIFVETGGSASASLTVDGSLFNDIESNIVRFSAGGSGTNDVNVLNNRSTNGGGPDDFPNGGGIELIVTNEETLTFDVQGNDIRDFRGDGIIVSSTAGGGNLEGRIGGPNASDGNTFSGSCLGDGIELSLDGFDIADSFTFTILVQNNDIGVDNTGVGGPFSGLGDDGIQILHRDHGGTLNLTIEDNTIRTGGVTPGICAPADTAGPGSEGIRLFTDEDQGIGANNPTSNIRIVNNSFPSIGSGEEAIELRTRDTSDGCFHVSGNDNGAGGSPGTIDPDQGGSSTLQITQASLATLSTANNGATVTGSGTATFNGTCANPTLPSN